MIFARLFYLAAIGFVFFGRAPVATGAVQASLDRVGPMELALSGSTSGIGTQYHRPQSVVLDHLGVPCVVEGALTGLELHRGAELVLWQGQVLAFGDKSGVLAYPLRVFATETARWTTGRSLHPLLIDAGIPNVIWPSGLNSWPLQLRNERAFLWVGRPTRGPGVPTGAFWLGANLRAGNDHAALAWASRMDAVTGQIRSGFVLFRCDDYGEILSEELIVDQFQPGPNGMGDVFGYTDLDFSFDERMAFSVSTSVAAGAWVDGQFVLVLGDPGPLPGETISDVWHVAVNRHGDWAVGCDLNTGGYAIYRNGQVLVHGDSHFGPGRRMTSVREVSINDRGDVVYEYALDNSTSHVGLNGEVLISSGGQIEGRTIRDVMTTARNAVADRQGRQIFLEGNFVGSFDSFAAALTLDLSDPVCPGVPTSAGTEPGLGVYRSLLAESARASVYAKRLPPLAQTLLVSGQVQANLPGVGGAIGALCISPALRSLPKQAEADGTVEHFIRPSLAAVGAAPPQVGERWLFQLWYRDVDPTTGAPVSRFTEAVEMTFE